MIKPHDHCVCSFSGVFFCLRTEHSARSSLKNLCPFNENWRTCYHSLTGCASELFADLLALNRTDWDGGIRRIGFMVRCEEHFGLAKEARCLLCASNCIQLIPAFGRTLKMRLSFKSQSFTLDIQEDATSVPTNLQLQQVQCACDLVLSTSGREAAQFASQRSQLSPPQGVQHEETKV